MFYSFGHSIISDKLQNRFWFFVYPLPVCIIGCLVFMFTNSFGPRYFALFLLNFAFASFGTIYSWNSNVIPRPPAKRTVALAFMNSVCNMASIWTPFTYTQSSAPHYHLAMGIVIGLLAVCAALAVVLRFMMQKMNRELDRLEDENVELTEKELTKLRKTAEIEGISMAEARQLQKGYRYII